MLGFYKPANPPDLHLWAEYTFEPNDDITAPELAWILSTWIEIHESMWAPVGFNIGPHFKPTGKTERYGMRLPQAKDEWHVRFPKYEPVK